MTYKDGVFYPSNDSPKREWCSQHGYPMPCVKCNGMTKEEMEEFSRSLREAVKPESSRLLSDGDIETAIGGEPPYGMSYEMCSCIAKAQDAKTAQLFGADLKALEAAHQARIDRLIAEIETVSLLGDVGGKIKIVILHKDWQELKDRYLKKG